jgi:hypothetical protein
MHWITIVFFFLVIHDNLSKCCITKFILQLILQLKSVQTRDALDFISNIIKSIRQKFDYKIKGHEIHEISRNMEKIPLSDRVNLVSSFCARNELEYLTYHAPIIKANIYDKKENQKIINSNNM